MRYLDTINTYQRRYMALIQGRRLPSLSRLSAFGELDQALSELHRVCRLLQFRTSTSRRNPARGSRIFHDGRVRPSSILKGLHLRGIILNVLREIAETCRRLNVRYSCANEPSRLRKPRVMNRYRPRTTYGVAPVSRRSRYSDIGVAMQRHRWQ